MKVDELTRRDGVTFIQEEKMVPALHTLKERERIRAAEGNRDLPASTERKDYRDGRRKDLCLLPVLKQRGTSKAINRVRES